MIQFLNYFKKIDLELKKNIFNNNMEEKKRRGRPRMDEKNVGKPFDYKEYYKEHADKFRVEGNIKYYRKITKTAKEEMDVYIKLGFTPDKILAKLKEKALIQKLQKLT
jgi:hypothetical protein